MQSKAVYSVVDSIHPKIERLGVEIGGDEMREQRGGCRRYHDGWMGYEDNSKVTVLNE